ncbi:hypothetical protein C4588_02080 [Candidatus Parcubacteria bacterium]|nr:MAG: hypothetical protein C4588_02080 [Candidatus Parcubacteria bacterium]
MKTLSRKPKAQVGKLFVAVMYKDKKSRPKTLLIPGSEGKQYQVIIRRYEKGVDPFISTECQLRVYNGYLLCPGNVYHSKLCYHSIAAIDFCIAEAKMVGSWCNTYEDALKLNQMKKGKIIKVKSHQSRAEMFVVVSKPEPKQLALPI